MQSVYIEFKGTFYLRTLHTHGGWKKIGDTSLLMSLM